MIRNWRSAWRMFSVQLLALLALVAEVWSMLSYEEQSLLIGLVPEAVRPHIISIFALLVIVARLKNQGLEK